MPAPLTWSLLCPVSGVQASALQSLSKLAACDPLLSQAVVSCGVLDSVVLSMTHESAPVQVGRPAVGQAYQCESSMAVRPRQSHVTMLSRAWLMTVDILHVAGLHVAQAGANMVLASVAGSSVDFARRVLEAGGLQSNKFSVNVGSSMRGQPSVDPKVL